MRNLGCTASLALVLALRCTAAPAATPDISGLDPQDPLFKEVSALDGSLFDAFNHCSSKAELRRHAGYLDEKLEFYHDNGGVTWSRRDYMANTERNVCGRFQRRLVAGTLQVFPIKDYGAIEQGVHRFCGIESDECFGEAMFLITWHRLDNGDWRATRIFSYGHRPTGQQPGESQPATPGPE